MIVGKVYVACDFSRVAESLPNFGSAAANIPKQFILNPKCAWESSKEAKAARKVNFALLIAG